MTVPLTDLVTAFTLLTRLPVARFARPGEGSDLARCVWAFPIVGLVVNGLGGLAYWLAYRAGVPPLVGAGWALAIANATTGALHDDGLADTADGFGGGATTARKLEIMRDSRIGGYGVLAVVLPVVIRVAAIAALVHPGRVMTAMIVAGILGRGGILVILWVLRPARDDGMGVAMGALQPARVAAGLGLAIAAALLALPLPMAIAAVLPALGAALAVARLAYTQIGGYTGDVLGAGEVVTECVVLTVASSMFD